MKLLTFYCDRFAYRTEAPSLEGVAPVALDEAVEGAVVAWFHLEAGDAERLGKVTTGAIKHLKWLARKWGTRRIVLHSFAHLAETTAPPEAALAFLERAESRLVKAGYEVHRTAFGHTHRLEMAVPGPSLAKVFKSL
ncbi:MAG: hypothetical protein D6739_08750 [Nitrospirae bacterium]|nr:MAG: hypothetical protein D6739_08750 [Nitrospirota bacterium]